jgi:hypothetical protein
MIEMMSFDNFHAQILNLQLVSLQARIYCVLLDATILYDFA